MLKNLFIIALILFLSGCHSKEINILLITSERKTPDQEFFEMFNNFNNVTSLNINQPTANEWIEKKKADSFDVLVFYDLNDSITPSQKKAYFRLLEQGKPMLFLHHTLVSYQKWPEFTQIIGGKYNREDSIRGPSTFQHNITIPVNVIDSMHPITLHIPNFTIEDESYNNCLILDDVQPLLQTDRLGNMPNLAWIHQVKNAKVVYIQMGHDKSAFNNLQYRQLIYQAIKYLSASVNSN